MSYHDFNSLLDRRLALALYEADKSGDGGEAVTLALDPIIARLGIPLDSTEQGLTPDAAEKVEAFMVAHAVTVYDNGGKTFDRYTVVFPDGDALGIGPTGNVPNGFCQSIAADELVEGDHLGTRVPFDSIPEPVRKAVRDEWTAFYAGGRV